VRALRAKSAAQQEALGTGTALRPLDPRDVAAYGDGPTGASGLVLSLEDRPLAGVSVRIGDWSTRTDCNGRFTLAGIAPGHHELFIDGGTDQGGRDYAQSIIGVDMQEGQMHTLPFAVFLPRIRPQDWYAGNLSVLSLAWSFGPVPRSSRTTSRPSRCVRWVASPAAARAV